MSGISIYGSLSECDNLSENDQADDKQLMRKYQMSQERIRELREAFRVIDENHDGTLSYSELGKLIRLVSPDYSDSEITLLMHKSDVNGDGKISFDEFVRLMSFGTKDDISTTEEAFGVFDSDKDGFITKLELSQVMQRIGHKYTDSEIESMLAEADQDGDGKVTYEEFKAMLDT
ncbi:hypothetical protein CRM22_004701 [Opisthorchis felineus]|uniref:EF-hand domain-containing protein n=1 Tax=Opisthorchis felineus TaxID=147828 RepID=A0A4S2LUY1_OPIFE|nr:hypothetical protein CRM22_004701 [Opisthorchis felineus]